MIARLLVAFAAIIDLWPFVFVLCMMFAVMCTRRRVRANAVTRVVFMTHAIVIARHAHVVACHNSMSIWIQSCALERQGSASTNFAVSLENAPIVGSTEKFVAAPVKPRLEKRSDSFALTSRIDSSILAWCVCSTAS